MSFSCPLHGEPRMPPFCYDCEGKQLANTAKELRETLSTMAADHPDRPILSRFADYCERKAKRIAALRLE